MPVAKLKVQQQIANIIKRFKFDELETSVMTTFPEISWTDLKSALVKHRRAFISTNVALVFRQLISEAKIEDKVLCDRLLTLQLIDISWHSKKSIWYCYTFTDSNRSSSYLTSTQIQTNMQDYFDSLNIATDIRINVHNDITYISLMEKVSTSRKRKLQHVRPIYVAFFMDQKYFFSTHKHLSSDILNAVAKGVGFDNPKRLKLSGRVLQSLNQLCWNKKEGAVNSENVTEDLTYIENEPDIRDTGVDFTQQNARENYTKRCFSDNPPNLEKLVCTGLEIPFSHESIAMELAGEEISVKWEFRSRDIATWLSKLIERRVLVTPVPHYISNLMTLGRNELTLARDSD
ncbi:uncharacterized protein LOC108628796 [Ceratina calcarata]|uniref:Uncharacterized protein LOC108628796 n=1 Tax=Ceratina calcarata TaxID=156304 RepID=A0AAJ7NAZ9_9HYME|nr:uncharacterized protein LOC108628796 [Ceratina calcarata]